MSTNQRSFSKKLMIIGALLALAPPAILFSIFRNNEITGPVTQALPLTPLFILSGIILLVVGFTQRNPDASSVIADKLHLNNPVMDALVKKRPAYNWIWWFVFAVFWATPPFSTSWSVSGKYDQAISHWVAWILPAVLLLSTIITKAVRKAPWYVVLIGDLDLNPKDEREAMILRKAGQTTLAASIIILLAIFEILLLAPKPSPIALLDMFVIAVFIIRGIYSFLAWRMGLK